MAQKLGKPALCRLCGRRFEAEPGAACPSCGRRRIIAHPELHILSIAHLDCDAFFAAIEKRDDPSLADRPVIVGGGARGVVTTACYVARTFGVRSAMPMFKALKACPDAVVVKPNFAKYADAARAVRLLMEQATPLVEPLSIDEAVLDLAGTERLHKRSPAETLHALQRDIKNEIGITVSIGLSANRFLAKLASDFDKPEGFSVIGAKEAEAVLKPMPVTAISGVGAVFATRLAQDGYRTIGDLQRADAAFLRSRYGDVGARLADLSRGHDARLVRPERETKSVSSETTFNADISDRVDLEAILWTLCERTASRMKEKGLAGRTATLKLKTAAFAVISRSRQLAEPSNLARVLFDAVQPLLAAEAGRAAYRLIGAGYSALEPAGAEKQPLLFADQTERLRKEEEAIDKIRRRYGDDAIALGRSRAAKLGRSNAAGAKVDRDGTS